MIRLATITRSATSALRSMADLDEDSDLDSKVERIIQDFDAL